MHKQFLIPRIHAKQFVGLVAILSCLSVITAPVRSDALIVDGLLDNILGTSSTQPSQTETTETTETAEPTSPVASWSQPVVTPITPSVVVPTVQSVVPSPAVQKTSPTASSQTGKRVQVATTPVWANKVQPTITQSSEPDVSGVVATKVDTAAQAAATANAQSNKNQNNARYESNKIDSKTAATLLLTALSTSGVAAILYSATYLPSLKLGTKLRTLLSR